MTKAELLDRIESALVRAEDARKDIDLILVMRVAREMLEQDVKKTHNKCTETSLHITQ